MAASLTGTGAEAAAVKVSTPATGGGGHRPGGGDDSDAPDLTTDDMVAFSARLIAAARAVESRRADRLFNDPYAELLSTARGAGPDAMRSYTERAKVTSDLADSSSTLLGATSSTGPVADATAPAGDGMRSERETGTVASKRLAIRTRFIDDFFEDCAGPRGIKQIVSVGAGMDTRGLRLKAAPGTKVFEVDQALVLRVKNALLSKAPAEECSAEGGDDGVGQAEVIAVEADLSQAGWEGELFEAGFDPTRPSAWILEGLTMYLEEQELVTLLRTLAERCASNSAFCATSVSAESVAKAQAGGSGIFGTWKWGCDDPQAFFEASFPAGWRFKGVKCGTPGEFPDGADYGVGFQGKGPAYVVGYYSSAAP
eukprot:jgi/Undpi1/12729/HiC_scaffold_6.g02397.m1